MFRPQFPYPLAAPPCVDQAALYSFDQTNTPVLSSGSLAAGTPFGRIPLKLDRDSAFLLRGVQIQGKISVRIEDPSGNPLSDSENSVLSTNFEIPTEWGDPGGAGFVALDSGAGGIYAHAGGTFLAYLYNNTASSINLNTVAITLHGVKRYPEEGCAQ